MKNLHAPQPEDLARELRVVLRVGARPGRVAQCLDQMESLVCVCANEIPPGLPYDRAIAVCRAIEVSIDSLGDGPFGEAARALFGTRGSSRGLILAVRRRLAAAELNIDAATLVRHREADMLCEIAVGLYKLSGK